MHISFERRGGFTGIPVTIDVNTDTLSPDEASQLHHLVEAAGFFQLPSTLPAPAQPDRFQYTVTVQEKDHSHTITVGESAVPATLQSLLDALMDVARRR